MCCFPEKFHRYCSSPSKPSDYWFATVASIGLQNPRSVAVPISVGKHATQGSSGERPIVAVSTSLSRNNKVLLLNNTKRILLPEFTKICGVETCYGSSNKALLTYRHCMYFYKYPGISYPIQQLYLYEPHLCSKGSVYLWSLDEFCFWNKAYQFNCLVDWIDWVLHVYSYLVVKTSGVLLLLFLDVLCMGCKNRKREQSGVSKEKEMVCV